MSYAAVSTAMDAAVTALGLGDYATARDKALAAQAVLSILPDTQRNAGGGGQENMTWDRVAVSQFIDRMQSLANSAKGITTSNVVKCPLSVQGVSQAGIW